MLIAPAYIMQVCRCFNSPNNTLHFISPGFGRFSAAFSAYTPAFTGLDDDDFLTFWGVNEDKSMFTKDYTRGQFLLMARQAAGALVVNGQGKGSMVCHYFSGNTVEDLAFRLAAAMVGTIPVTINWQADPVDRILYKIWLTESKMILVDSGVNKEHIQIIKSKFPSIVLYNISELEAEDPMDLTSSCSSIGPTHPHMVIFTSGTTGNPKVPST